MARGEAERHFLRVLATLNEAQARWLVAQQAIARGRGGLQAMHELTGLSRPRITRGMRELRQRRRLEREPGRVREAGGGRKRLEASDPCSPANAQVWVIGTFISCS